MKKKVLAVFLCTALVAVASVLGTLAYLTDRESVVNTFTVGNVDIRLDEADVDEDGKLIVDEEGNPVERVTGNEYHLIPGQTYIKDPTVTVLAGSEESYVRMLVTVNCLSELEAIFTEEGISLKEVLFNGVNAKAPFFADYDSETWIFYGEKEDDVTNSITYEFRYKEIVTGENEDKELEALFESFTLPGPITKEQLQTIAELKITLEGHAIQSATFENAEEAWEAFEIQNSEV